MKKAIVCLFVATMLAGAVSSAFAERVGKPTTAWCNLDDELWWACFGW